MPLANRKSLLVGRLVLSCVSIWGDTSASSRRSMSLATRRSERRFILPAAKRRESRDVSGAAKPPAVLITASSVVWYAVGGVPLLLYLVEPEPEPVPVRLLSADGARMIACRCSSTFHTAPDHEAAVSLVTRTELTSLARRVKGDALVAVVINHLERVQDLGDTLPARGVGADVRGIRVRGAVHGLDLCIVSYTTAW